MIVELKRHISVATKHKSSHVVLGIVACCLSRSTFGVCATVRLIGELMVPPNLVLPSPKTSISPPRKILLVMIFRTSRLICDRSLEGTSSEYCIYLQSRRMVGPQVFPAPPAGRKLPKRLLTAKQLTKRWEVQIQYDFLLFVSHPTVVPEVYTYRYHLLTNYSSCFLSFFLNVSNPNFFTILNPPPNIFVKSLLNLNL